MQFKALLKKHGWTFIKYALVGASGTIIDVAGFTLLVERGVGRNIAAVTSFIAAVVNNYTWNRLWTFHSHNKAVKTQFVKFLLVSIIGLLLNLFFLSVFSGMLASYVQVSVEALPAWANASAKLGASGVVLIYNFLANRFWTFKESL